MNLSHKSSLNNEYQIDLDQITLKLCIERSKEGFKKRKLLFRQFDKNNNGYISYIEALEGIARVLELPEVSDCKPAVYQAFMAAKNSGINRREHSMDFIELNEFRYFLCYIRQYYEYYQMFSLINTDGNISISYDEFSSAIPLLKKWGINVENPKEVFDEVDKDHGHSIKFDEFCSWAIKKKLEYDGDNFYDECLKNLK